MSISLLYYRRRTKSLRPVSSVTRLSNFFTQPILLAGVTAKLDYKTWNEDRMAWTIQQFIKAYPQVQIIFNYAPGKEKENAYRIYEKMGKPQQVHIDIPQQRAAARARGTFQPHHLVLWKTKAAGRHIVHACGKPSFVIVAPTTNKKTWLPQNDVPADGIAYTDITNAGSSNTKHLTDWQNMLSSQKKRFGIAGLTSSKDTTYYKG